ncbi:hypothetical protein LguiB_019421 [Lonicera macranthoides]
MYGTTTCSNSSSSPPDHDDISLFLHQILHRSSSSTSPSPPFFPQKGKQMQSLTPSLLLPPENLRISGAESYSRPNLPSGMVFSSSAVDYFPVNAANLSSSSVGTIDNDPDEYDCESEEGLEALVEEASEKRTRRSSSKRSRAAEVHNLSEKRRRSRINEKMKALQNLIPNSNKTDKASMLDEAIEYLKQLQLQVQMLTMRNGLSLYPMCLPGLQPTQFSHARMGFSEGNGSLNINVTGSIPVNQEQLGTNVSNILNSETSFGLEMEPSIRAQRGPFGHPEEVCREGLLPGQQLNVDHSLTSSSGGAQLTNLERGPILSSDLDGMHTKSPSDGGVKSERLNF